MSVTLTNYIPFYYATVATIPVPSVVIGKFVQIMHGDTLFVVLSPKDFTKYHANIVERFCLDKGLEGRWDADRKRFSIRSGGWAVAGGGKFALDAKKKTLKLFDDSMAYGKFKSAGMQEQLNALPEFTGFAVYVE